MTNTRADTVRFIGRQSLFFLEADWIFLTKRICEAFQNARFFAESEENKRELRAINLELKNANDSRLIDARHPFHGRLCAIWDRSERDSLWAFPGQHWTYVLTNSRGWRPVWKASPITFEIQMLNLPDDSFSFFIADTYSRRLAQRATIAAAPTGDPQELLILDESMFNGTYAPGDDRKRKLLQRVARIIDKMTDSRSIGLDLADWSVRFVAEKGNRTRIARHAKAWAMAHPRRVLGRLYEKPIEWLDRPAGPPV